MGEDVILSIVVPAYNVAGFIERCLASLEALPDSVEVIVIDDGSTDATAERVELAISRLGNARLIRQPNSGLGAARNRGNACAQGDYVWFVDADDYLKPGAIHAVVVALQAKAPDILVVDFSCADEAGSRIDWVACPFRNDRGDTLFGSIFFSKHYATTYAFLYVMRRSMLESNRLEFAPRINMQDAELLPRVLAVADRVYVSGIDAYVYVKRSESFINSQDAKVREVYFQSVLEVRRRLASFAEGTLHPSLADGLRAKLAAIEQILLMAYVYDSLSLEMLRARLELLRLEGVFPFSGVAMYGMKQHGLKIGVNCFPVVFPRVYRWIRERSAVRGVLMRIREASR